MWVTASLAGRAENNWMNKLQVWQMNIHRGRESGGCVCVSWWTAHCQCWCQWRADDARGTCTTSVLLQTNWLQVRCTPMAACIPTTHLSAQAYRHYYSHYINTGTTTLLTTSQAHTHYINNKVSNINEIIKYTNTPTKHQLSLQRNEIKNKWCPKWQQSLHEEFACTWRAVKSGISSLLQRLIQQCAGDVLDQTFQVWI